MECACICINSDTVKGDVTCLSDKVTSLMLNASCSDIR
jgi:hypothetical protein